ncbi:uncharacterized protein LOC117219949 [Megalopta genalis]|uniref:uncharacterized protein LOC117219949 n=1 Tax=Megalopta genalis TaxID=115081 RepID=UPI003FD4B517
MSRTRILMLMVLLLSQRDNVRGKSLDNFLVNNESNEYVKTLQSNVHRNPRSHHSWMLPVSTFSVNNLFKDNSGDVTALKKGMETIQKNQEEMLKLLRQLAEGPKAALCESPSVPTSNNDDSNIEPEDFVYDKSKQSVVDILDNKKKIANGNSNTPSDSQNKVIHDDLASDENATKLMQMDNETFVDPSKTDNSSAKLDVNENISDEYSDKNTTEVEFISHLKEKVFERIRKLMRSENDLKNREESSKSSNSEDIVAEEIGERNVQPANEGSSNYMGKNFKGMPLTYDGDGNDA